MTKRRTRLAEDPVEVLTPRQAEVLAVMQAFDEDLVYERGVAYLGTTRVSARLVWALLRRACLTLESGTVGGFERYCINSTGRRSVRAHWGLE